MGKIHKARKRWMDFFFFCGVSSPSGGESIGKSALRVITISGTTGELQISSERAYDFQLTLCSCRLVITSVYVGVLFYTHLNSELRNWKWSH